MDSTSGENKQFFLSITKFLKIGKFLRKRSGSKSFENMYSLSYIYYYHNLK